MAEATYKQDGFALDYTPVVALTAGQVIQLADGRAAVPCNEVDAAIMGSVQTGGVHRVTKAADLYWVDGAEIYWDHSANAATPVPPLVAGDKDFFIGTAVGDWSAAAVIGHVNLNVRPQFIIDFHRDMGDSLI